MVAARQWTARLRLEAFQESVAKPQRLDCAAPDRLFGWLARCGFDREAQECVVGVGIGVDPSGDVQSVVRGSTKVVEGLDLAPKSVRVEAVASAVPDPVWIILLTRRAARNASSQNGMRARQDDMNSACACTSRSRSGLFADERWHIATKSAATQGTQHQSDYSA